MSNPSVKKGFGFYATLCAAVLALLGFYSTTRMRSLGWKLGMLLAATNGACGCKVIFVDDSVPEGTQIK